MPSGIFHLYPGDSKSDSEVGILVNNKQKWIISLNEDRIQEPFVRNYYLLPGTYSLEVVMHLYLYQFSNFKVEAGHVYRLRSLSREFDNYNRFGIGPDGLGYYNVM